MKIIFKLKITKIIIIKRNKLKFKIVSTVWCFLLVVSLQTSLCQGTVAGLPQASGYQLYRWLSKILVFIETCGIMILLFAQNRPPEKHESPPYLEFYLKTKYNHPFHRIRMKNIVWMLKVSAQIHDISNLWRKKRFQNLLERRNSISHPLRAASIRI